MGFFSFTVDLDELHCYHAIHGLDKPGALVSRVVYQRALGRLVQFIEDLKIPATLFVVGKDLQDNPEAGGILRDLANNGLEIGNHSMSHRYDMSMLTVEEQRGEIVRASEAIRDFVGVVPRGFRAPGYNTHMGIIELLEQHNMLYDSSVFPCPLYYSAKAAAIGIKSFRGKRSASIMGDPRVLMAPTGPYRIGEDGVWCRGQGMREFPISVITGARLPLLGTFLSMMGAYPASVLAKKATGSSFLNLEFHGMDFVDADGDGIGYLKKYQGDLKVSLTKRLKLFRSVIQTLLDAGLEPVTLAGAAGRIFLG